MEQPTISPEYILEYEPKDKRIIKVEANVVAYFGDLFHALKEGLSKTDRVSPVQPK
jgi:hypothetical protein